MPLPGTGEIGNPYERRWAVLMMLDVVEGKASAIRIEVPGEEGTGFEFRLSRETSAEWHQCKAGPQRWTIHALCTQGVVQPFFSKTSRGEKCVLLVEAGAPELHELITRAKQSESWDEFSNEFLSDTWREHFDVLAQPGTIRHLSEHGLHYS